MPWLLGLAGLVFLLLGLTWGPTTPRDLLVGLVAGIVAAAAWAAIDASMRRQRNKKNFAGLAGRYRVRRKFVKAADDGPGEVVVITVNSNILSLHSEGLPPGDSITGVILMSEAFPRSGEGFYQHIKNGQQLWGFRRVQVNGTKQILVHTEFAPPDEQLKTQGYVWEKL